MDVSSFFTQFPTPELGGTSVIMLKSNTQADEFNDSDGDRIILSCFGFNTSETDPQLVISDDTIPDRESTAIGVLSTP